MKKFNIKKKEIEILVAGLMSSGFEDTYNRMRNKVFNDIENKVAPDMKMDSALMDMSDTLLEYGRNEIKTGDTLLINIYYTLHHMLRKLAQEVNRKYTKDNKDERILQVVINKDAPQIIE